MMIRPWPQPDGARPPGAVFARALAGDFTTRRMAPLVASPACECKHRLHGLTASAHRM